MSSLDYRKIVAKDWYDTPFAWWLTFEDGTNGWSDLDVEIGGYLAYDDDNYEYYVSAEDYAQGLSENASTCEENCMEVGDRIFLLDRQVWGIAKAVVPEASLSVLFVQDDFGWDQWGEYSEFVTESVYEANEEAERTRISES